MRLADSTLMNIRRVLLGLICGVEDILSKRLHTKPPAYSFYGRHTNSSLIADGMVSFKRYAIVLPKFSADHTMIFRNVKATSRISIPFGTSPIEHNSRRNIISAEPTSDSLNCKT